MESVDCCYCGHLHINSADRRKGLFLNFQSIKFIYTRRELKISHQAAIMWLRTA
jgi:hypothetical protein